MIADAFLPPVAALLNRGIHSRRDAAELCEALVGKSFITRIEGLPTGAWAIRMAASFDGVTITPATDEEIEVADVVLSGTPLELRRLMFVDREASIRSGRVTFSGDIETAERFRDLLLVARPDLEGRLTAWLGEPAAFQLTNFARDLRDWVVDSADDIADRASEYLQDEARHVPTPEEVNEFCAAVDDVATDVERLEARIGRVARRTEPQQ